MDIQLLPGGPLVSVSIGIFFGGGNKGQFYTGRFAICRYIKKQPDYKSG